MEFIGEDGVDTGGLTREYFMLIRNSIAARYLEACGVFRHNATAYQVKSNLLGKAMCDMG